MHYFTIIKNYMFVPFVPVWSTPIIYNLIWSATLKVFIQELGLLKYNCFKLFLFLKLNIYFYIPLHIFFIVLVHLLILLSMNIIRLVDLVPENLATWVENARSSSCSNGVCLFSSLKAVVNLTSFSPVSSLQKWLITHKHRTKKTLNESSGYVYSNILPHFILNILVTWRHQYLNGSTNKSSL